MDNQDYKLNSSFSYLVILAVLIALGVAGRLFLIHQTLHQWLQLHFLQALFL